MTRVTLDRSTPPDRIRATTWVSVCLHGRIRTRSRRALAQVHPAPGVRAEPPPPSRPQDCAETNRDTKATALQFP